MASNAQVLTAVAAERFDVEPSFDLEGVVWLDGFIGSRALELKPETLTGLVDLCGAFLGECLIAMLGGSWREQGELVLVALADGGQVDPFWMVRSQLVYRDGYSVRVLVDCVPAIGKVAVGGLYASQEDDGGWSVVKVLAADHLAVHLRQYINVWNQRPEHIDVGALSWATDMAAIASGGRLGIGHFPLAHDGFWEMEPVLVQVEPVLEHELEGYRIWAGG